MFDGLSLDQMPNVDLLKMLGQNPASGLGLIMQLTGMQDQQAEKPDISQVLGSPEGGGPDPQAISQMFQRMSSPVGAPGAGPAVGGK